MANQRSLKAVKQALRKSLEEIGIEPSEAKAETDWIIGHITGWNASQQALEADSNLKPKSLEEIEKIVARRALREPLQYCLGHAWFMGRRFAVAPGVFIPRSDTETLVEVTLNLLATARASDLHILEIGIGSGAIAISLLAHLPEARVTAYEISTASIEVATANADTHGVLNRLTVINDDWHNVSNQAFNLVVSNPPYIPLCQRSQLPPEVAHYEPELALFGVDEDGLGHYRSIASSMRDCLTKPALAAVEVGDNQSEAVRNIFEEAGWVQTDIHLDLSGQPRVVSAHA